MVIKPLVSEQPSSDVQRSPAEGPYTSGKAAGGVTWTIKGSPKGVPRPSPEHCSMRQQSLSAARDSGLDSRLFSMGWWQQQGILTTTRASGAEQRDTAGSPRRVICFYLSPVTLSLSPHNPHTCTSSSFFLFLFLPSFPSFLFSLSFSLFFSPSFSLSFSLPLLLLIKYINFFCTNI